MTPFRLRKATNNEFYVLIKGLNGEELFKTSETYKRRAGAAKAVDALMRALHPDGQVPMCKIIDETKKPDEAQ